MSYNQKPNHEPNHEHCMHAFRGPILMVVPEGHFLMKCCKCPHMQTVHVEHMHEHRWEHAPWGPIRFPEPLPEPYRRFWRRGTLCVSGVL